VSASALTAVQERLGVTFGDLALLERALTHPSWAEENGGEHYERLEFLGDSVLGFIVADYLHGRFPDRPEGDLTRMKRTLVAGTVLASVGRELGLDAAVRMGRGASRATARDSVVEACFEAVVGAVYLDTGLDAARGLVLRALGDRTDHETLSTAENDPKSALQELAQARGLGLPRYRIVSTEGPAHEPRFAAEVVLGDEPVASGEGTSKQAAERAAALAALARLPKPRGGA
jgi:ribonuclease-3